MKSAKDKTAHNEVGRNSTYFVDSLILSDLTLHVNGEAFDLNDELALLPSAEQRKFATAQSTNVFGAGFLFQICQAYIMQSARATSHREPKWRALSRAVHSSRFNI